MATLVLTTDTGREEQRLGAYTTIGRHPRNAIALADPLVSSDHCLICLNDKQQYVVRDLGSRNGTFVNWRPITTETVLQSGDLLVLGHTRCEFVDTRGEVRAMVELGEGAQPHIHTSMVTPPEEQFLPEDQIRNARTLRSDYEKLRVAHELHRDIGTAGNVDEVLSAVLERIFEFLPCERGVVLLTDRDGTLEPKAYRTRGEQGKIVVSTTLVNHVVRERAGIISTDATVDQRFKESQSIMIQGIRSTIAVPILSGQELLGVIVVDTSASANAFSEKDLHVITGIANQTGQVVRNRLLHEELRLSFDRSISTLAAVVDARHPLTAGHSERVTYYSLLIAREMSLDARQQEVLRFAGLLHDIGKIGIADRILLKNGQYTQDEQEEMKTHPEKTRSILEKFHFPTALEEVPRIASLHHEKLDGGGYPEGLAGDDIPLLSRILAVADVFDALTSRRDYPKYAMEETMSADPMPLVRAIDIIKNDSGTHFDPVVVDAFMACLPAALFHLRGSHFEPSYVDETLRTLGPNLEPLR